MYGVIELPGVRSLLASIDMDDWTINTAGTTLMATTRLKQFNIPIPKKMSTGDTVNKKTCCNSRGTYFFKAGTWETSP